MFNQLERNFLLKNKKTSEGVSNQVPEVRKLNNFIWEDMTCDKSLDSYFRDNKCNIVLFCGDYFGRYSLPIGKL